MKKNRTESVHYEEKRSQGSEQDVLSSFEEGWQDHQNFALRLKKQRKDLGLSQRRLSEQVGISMKTIQKYEYGDVPKGSNLVSLSRALGCSIDWLLLGADPGISESREGEALYRANEPEMVMIPRVLARLNAGGGSLETSGGVEGRHGFRYDWIRQKGKPSQMVLMDVSGDSMSPEIKDGDTVLIDRGQTNIYIGKIYAVSIGQEITVKYVERVPDKVILRSANRAWNDIEVDIRGDLGESVKILGRVIWWCREAR